MPDRNPGRALDIVRRIEMMCDFREHPAIRRAAEAAVPVTMPRDVGALGFDVPLWVGLGIVGLWAALDAFSERASLCRPSCPTCCMKCVPARFAAYAVGNDATSLEELDDLRHLYAHNYAGEADGQYFASRKRHVLKPVMVAGLTCGAAFDGTRAQLEVIHLRFYAQTARRVLGRFP